MKKMFIALGIAFVIFCAAITPNYNAYAREYRAEQAKIEAIENEFKDQFIERYGEDNYRHVTNIDIEVNTNYEGTEDISYCVHYDGFSVPCRWTIDPAEVEIA